MFTSNGANNHHPQTTITHLLISWPFPTSLFYSSLSPSSPLHNNQAFPFSTAVDSETSSESRNEDRHVLKSGDVEERSQNTGNLPLNDKSGDEDRHVVLKSEDSKERGRNNSGKVPLSDVTNSNLTNSSDHSKCHNMKKEQQAQHHPFKFDAFMTPEHQPFQTSWSTVFYTPDNRVENSSCAPLTKRGSYVCRLSPTGSIAALALNRKEALNTAVVFFSPLVDAAMSTPLYLSKAKEKTGRYTKDGPSFPLLIPNIDEAIPPPLPPPFPDSSLSDLLYMYPCFICIFPIL